MDQHYSWDFDKYAPPIRVAETITLDSLRRAVELLKSPKVERVVEYVLTQSEAVVWSNMLAKKGQLPIVSGEIRYDVYPYPVKFHIVFPILATLNTRETSPSEPKYLPRGLTSLSPLSPTITKNTKYTAI